MIACISACKKRRVCGAGYIKAEAASPRGDVESHSSGRGMPPIGGIMIAHRPAGRYNNPQAQRAPNPHSLVFWMKSIYSLYCFASS